MPDRRRVVDIAVVPFSTLSSLPSVGSSYPPQSCSRTLWRTATALTLLMTAAVLPPVLSWTPRPSMSAADADAAVHVGPLGVGRRETLLKQCSEFNRILAKVILISYTFNLFHSSN